MGIRLIFGGIILFGCGMLGMVMSGRYKKRLNQLIALENAVMQLEYDIDFLNITLEESFKKISVNTEKEVGEIFSYMAGRIKKDRCADLQKLWDRACQRCGDELCLSGEDIMIMSEFTKNLGRGNREKEKNNLRLAQMRLKVAEDEAREESKLNSKMYRGLGILVGIFMVVVLL